MRNLLGGWQISGIANYYSGGPLGFSAEGNPLNTGFNRPNIAPGATATINWGAVNQVDASGNPVLMLHTTGIMDPGTWAVGNAPRNIDILRYRWSFNEDMGFAKKFYFGERVKAEFRIEFFNVFNRVMKNCGPDTFIPDIASGGGFGLAPQTCQSNGPRTGQAFIRINF
jgi:hypothetical protein